MYQNFKMSFLKQIYVSKHQEEFLEIGNASKHQEEFLGLLYGVHPFFPFSRYSIVSAFCILPWGQPGCGRHRQQQTPAGELLPMHSVDCRARERITPCCLSGADPGHWAANGECYWWVVLTQPRATFLHHHYHNFQTILKQFWKKWWFFF